MRPNPGRTVPAMLGTTASVFWGRFGAVLTRSYRVIRWLIRRLLGLFFRRIDVIGLENVPIAGGGLFVSWHPNALVDPALIFVSCPRRIAFGARHGIFSWPIVGRMARAIGTVPIYRAQDFADAEDETARRLANQKSLDTLAQAVAGGEFTALFPEGLSHDDPKLRALKPGAARLYYRALGMAPSELKPVLIPVGLHYDEKHALGSRVLIAYHPPIDLPATLRAPLPAEANEIARRQRYEALTQEIEESLKNVVHATENAEIHQLLHRARTLVRAERAARSGARLAAPDMQERVLGFSRLWIGYNALKRTHAAAVERLLRRIRRYENELNALALDDHELDVGDHVPFAWRTVQLMLQIVAVFVLLPPVLVLGFVVNLLPAAIVWSILRWRAKQDKDEATIKILAGAGAFPLAWLAAGCLTAIAFGETFWGHLMLGAVATAAAACGSLLVVHYQRFAAQTLRAIRIRFTQRAQADTLARLRSERSAICDAVERLAAGVELPGRVLQDGRVA